VAMAAQMVARVLMVSPIVELVVMIPFFRFPMNVLQLVCVHVGPVGALS